MRVANQVRESAQVMQVQVDRVREEAENIRSYRLRPLDGRPLPAFTPGAHIDLLLPADLIRQYSLCNYYPDDDGYYEIGVLREPSGRGGSEYVHQSLTVGDVIAIEGPRNHFELDENAHSILIAGGIGITPLLSMCRNLSVIDASFELHYLTRRPETAAFTPRLRHPSLRDRVHHHYARDDIESGRLYVNELLAEARPGTHIYCCGPPGLIECVRQAAGHWPAGSISFERFVAANTDEANLSSFEIEIASSGQICVVPEDKSILRVLREIGICVESQCEEGLCGTCETGLLEGEAEHRDSVLSDDEKAEQSALMVCCSRARSPRLKLDL